MMDKYFFLIYLVLFSVSSHAQIKASHLLKKSEQISVQIIASGDFKAEYELSGPLGSILKAEVSGEKPICEISSMFRKIRYRGKNAIESWLTLECNNNGQSFVYKPHRIYLDVTGAKQKIKLPMLDKNLKNVQFEFQELSLKLGK